MIKATAITAATLVALSAPAFAGGHTQNKDAAQGMVAAIKGAAAATGLPGASVARTLQGDLKGGWGNVGSGLFGVTVAKPKR